MRYLVVVPENADATTVFAAEELRSFVDKATKIKIEIIAENLISFSAKNRYFCLGNTRVAKDSGIALSENEANGYGFVFEKKDNKLFIFGAKPRGTLYGVYEYLERVLGIRFVAEDETYISESDADLFSVSSGKKIPEFYLRSYLTESAVKDPLFSARKRFNTLDCLSVREYGGSLAADFVDECHNTLKLVRPDVWARIHPEFFAFEGNGYGDICWSNGLDDEGNLSDAPVSVAKILIQGLKERILQNPSAKFFTVGQTDTIGDYCQCERCRKLREKYGKQSSLIVRMMNAVTRKIVSWAKKIGREVFLVTFAYSYSEDPPVNFDESGKPYVLDQSVICHPNLYVRLAAMSHNAVYAVNSEKQGELYKRLSGWEYVAKHFMIWEYDANFCEYLWYYPSLLHIRENCRYYKKIGADYVMLQGEHNGAINFTDKIKCYVASALLWDNNADVEALKEEFLRLYYKESYATVKKILDLFDNRIEALLEQDIGYGAHMYLHNYGAETDARFFPKELLCEMEESIAREIGRLTAEEKDEVLIRRLKIVSLVPKRMLLFNYRKYFGDSGEKEYALAFCALCEELGIEKLSEGAGGIIPENGLEFGITVKKLKEKYNKN